MKVLGIADLDSETGLNQAKAIKNMLEEWSIEQRCVAMCFDTTASNTGKFAGACVLLEALTGHPLLWTSCMPSPYAGSHSGICLQSNIRSFQ